MFGFIPQRRRHAVDCGARRAEDERASTGRIDEAGRLLGRGFGPLRVARLGEVTRNVEHRLFAKVEG